MSRSMPREVAEFLRELAFGGQPMGGLGSTRELAARMVEKYAPPRYVPGMAVVVDVAGSAPLRGTVYRIDAGPRHEWLYDVAVAHTVDDAGVRYATVVERVAEARLTPVHVAVAVPTLGFVPR